MWYYVPNSECLNSAPVTGGFSLDSDPWHGREPWVTASGTPTQRPFSWRGWKNRDWIKRLSGMTLKPSSAQAGVDAWISSLRDSHASHSAQPVSDVVLTMIGGSGPKSRASSAKWDRATCSWRTCHSLFDTDSLTSSMILPKTGSMRNGVCTPQPPLAPLTNANASGLWRTPRAGEMQGNGKNSAQHGGIQLKGQARMWPSGDAAETVSSLTVAVKLWATPQAANSNQRAVNPAASPFGMSLVDHVKLWPTPRASEGFRGTDPQHGTGGPSLKHIVSHQAVTTSVVGPNGLQRVDLNPAFVATLMGLPPDWLTPYTSAATDSSHNARPKHGHNLSQGSTMSEAVA